MIDREAFLSEAEETLRKRFLEEGGQRPQPPMSVAGRQSRVEMLVVPDEVRGKMPLTKSKYIVRENPHLIQWEREVRKFLRRLSPDHEHRISAVMIYEWATGIRITELMELEKASPKKNHTTWRADLRKLNKILAYYFGKPYSTWIAGKKVPKAYRVKQNFLITRKRPMSLTLWTEFTSGVLTP